MQRRAWLFLTFLFLVPVSSAFAWGRQGHRVVGRIAARKISPDTGRKIAKILGVHVADVEAAMAQASTWPDEINKPATKTAAWHFVDVPISAPFEVGNLCAEKNCVIERIQDMSDRLRLNQTGFELAKPPSPARPMTSQELAFLIHFVGDIHQPLHAANNADRGGNCESLVTPLVHADGSRPTTELHAAWDVDEVLAVLEMLGNETETANALFQQSNNGTIVQELTVTDWARESNDIAKRDVYQKLKIPVRTGQPGQCAPGIGSVDVNQQYLTGNVPVVEQQLLRAGIRLANVLDQICAGQGCKAKPR